MAAREDIILRILSDSTQVKQDLVGLKAALDQALAAMVQATKQPDFNPLSDQAKRLAANVTVAGQAFFGAFNLARKESKELGQTLDLVEKELRDVEKESEKFGKSGAKHASELSKAFTGFKRVLATLGLAFGVRELFQFGKEAVLVTVRLEAMQAQLKAAAGSAEAGADLFKFVTTEANRLGQSYFVVGEATARFEAATRNSNLALEERRQVITSVLEAARVLQLSEQRVGNSLLALEQIASKGTVSLEELRRQLGDNIPGAVNILANEMGVGVHELYRMIEANEVLSEDALPALARGFDKAFGGGLQAALDTTATKLGQVKNRVIDIQVEFGNAFSEALIKSIAKFNEEVSTLEAGARTGGQAAAFLTEGLLSLAASGGRAGEGMAHLFLIIDNDIEGFKALTEETDKLRETTLAYAESLPGTVNNVDDLGQATIGLSQSLSALQAAGALDSDALARLNEVALKLADAAKGELSPVLEGIIDFLADLGAESETSTEKLSRLTSTLDRLVAGGHRSSGALQVLSRDLDSFVASGANSRVVAGELADRVDEMIASHERAGERVPLALVKIRQALQEVLDAYKSGAQQVDAALDDMAAAHAKFEGELIRDAKAAADEAINLAVVVGNSVKDSFGGLAEANEVQIDALKSAIQKALDAYLLLGNEVPPILQDLANEHGVLSSIAEKELEKQVKAAEKAAKEEAKAIKERIKNFEKLADAIRDATRELIPESRTDEVTKDIKKLQTELKSLESKPIFDKGDQERIDKLKDELSKLRGELTDLEQGFEQTSATVEDVDDAIRDLLEGNADAFAQLNSSQRASIANLLSGLQSLAANGQASGGAVIDIFKQVTSVLDGAGVNTEALYEAFGDLDGQGLNVAQTMDRLLRAVEDSEEGQGSLAEQTKKTTEELEKQKVTLAKLVEEVEKLGVRGVAAMTPFRDIMAETLDICERLKECMESMK